MDLPMYLGASFGSYDELKRKIQEYQDANYIMLYLRDSKSLEKPRSSNSVRFQNVNSKLKYFYLLYRCRRGGRKFVSRSTGIRKKRSERGDDCPMYIKLSMTEDGFLQVIALNERHNHEIDKDEYLTNPKKRRLSEDEQKEVQRLLKGGVKSCFIKEYIKQKTGKTIFTKDICNLVIKEKKKNEFKEERQFEFVNVLQTGDIIADIIDNRFEIENSLGEASIKTEIKPEICMTNPEDLSNGSGEAAVSSETFTMGHFNSLELPPASNKLTAFCTYLASELESLSEDQCDEIIEHCTLKLFEVKRRNRK